MAEDCPAPPHGSFPFELHAFEKAEGRTPPDRSFPQSPDRAELDDPTVRDQKETTALGGSLELVAQVAGQNLSVRPDLLDPLDQRQIVGERARRFALDPSVDGIGQLSEHRQLRVHVVAHRFGRFDRPRLRRDGNPVEPR